MSERARQLAEEFERTNTDFISVVEPCSAEEWATICAEEGWPVAVTAHHVAEYHLVIRGWIETVVGGQPLTMTYQDIDAVNEQHLRAHPHPGHAETLALLRENAAVVARYIRGLTDEDLAREAPVAIFANVDYSVETLIEAIQIFHIIGHLDSIKVTLGQGSATGALTFMQPHAT